MPLSSGTQIASFQLPIPSDRRLVSSTPDSAIRSPPVIPMSIAPSAHSTGMSSVRRNVTSIGISRTRANKLRSCRRYLSPAALSISDAISARRPLLGMPMRRLSVMEGVGSRLSAIGRQQYVRETSLSCRQPIADSRERYFFPRRFFV